MCDNAKKKICAAHEAGHAIWAHSQGFTINEINITDLEMPFTKIDYGIYKPIVAKFNKLTNPTNDDLQIKNSQYFIGIYVNILLAGDICESLTETNFNYEKIKLNTKSSDHDIINFITKGIKSSDYLSRHIQEVAICLSQSRVFVEMVVSALLNKPILDGHEIREHLKDFFDAGR